MNRLICMILFFHDTATTRSYTLSLHDALPIFGLPKPVVQLLEGLDRQEDLAAHLDHGRWVVRSEEHTSELQSLTNLVCRLLLEKKNQTQASPGPTQPPPKTPKCARTAP